MAKIPFYKIGSALKQNGTVDPLRGEKDEITGQYTTYTDPDTGAQGKLDSGRSYGKAYEIAQEKGLSPEGESQADYTKFAKWQLGSYRDTGRWASREDYKSYLNKDTNAGVQRTPVTPIKPPTTSGVDKSLNHWSSKIDSKKGWGNSLSKPTAEEVNIPDSQGLLRRRDGKGGFMDRSIQGSHADQSVSYSGEAGREARKDLKKEDLAGGLTRQETRWRKTVAKGMAAAKSAGINVVYKNEEGNPISTAKFSKGPTEEGLNRGKGRRKTRRMMRRANRIEKRMKQKRGGWQKAEYDTGK